MNDIDKAVSSIEYLKTRFKHKSVNISENDRNCLNNIIKGFNELARPKNSELLLCKMIMAYFKRFLEVYSGQGICMYQIYEKVWQELSIDASEHITGIHQELICSNLEYLRQKGNIFPSDFNTLPTQEQTEENVRQMLNEFLTNFKTIKS